MGRSLSFFLVSFAVFFAVFFGARILIGLGFQEDSPSQHAAFFALPVAAVFAGWATVRSRVRTK